MGSNRGSILAQGAEKGAEAQRCAAPSGSTHRASASLGNPAGTPALRPHPDPLSQTLSWALAIVSQFENVSHGPERCVPQGVGATPPPCTRPQRRTCVHGDGPFTETVHVSRSTPCMSHHSRKSRLSPRRRLPACLYKVCGQLRGGGPRRDESAALEDCPVWTKCNLGKAEFQSEVGCVSTFLVLWRDTGLAARLHAERADQVSLPSVTSSLSVDSDIMLAEVGKAWTQVCSLAEGRGTGVSSRKEVWGRCGPASHGSNLQPSHLTTSFLWGLLLS